MKSKVKLLLAMFAIMLTASIIWNEAYQLARLTHIDYIDYKVFDFVAFFIFGLAMVPSVIIAAKEKGEEVL